jgi:hypothetical protein
MNLSELQTKLLAAARKSPPSDHVPYAFEKRIMAHLTKPIVVDVWALWGRGLWRAAAACVVAMALIGGWSYHASHEATDLSQAFENTVYAALDEGVTPDVDEDAW